MTTRNIFKVRSLLGGLLSRITDCLLQHGDGFTGGEDHSHRFSGWLRTLRMPILNWKSVQPPWGRWQSSKIRTHRGTAS